MTFEARELSEELGEPILLATFALGEKLWRFVRADQDVLHDGNTYLCTPGGIEPTRFHDSTETRKNDVTLTVDRSFPIAELWRMSPPAGIVAVRLVEIHAGEVDDAVSWLGHVSNVSWKGEARAEITMSPGSMAMRTNGLRRLWQKNCSHVLYGPKCRLSRVGEPVPGTLTAVDDAELVALEFDGAFDLAGGRITWEDDDTVPHSALILTHDGDTITLAAGDATLEVGRSVVVYPVLHQVRTALATASGLVLTSPDFDNGMQFNGGFIEWTDDEGVTDWRAIVSHIGNTVRMMTHAPRLEPGMVVTAVEGCNRTIARCGELDNTANYGGIPYFINKNPFGGNPIF